VKGDKVVAKAEDAARAAGADLEKAGDDVKKMAKNVEKAGS
jgi:hypothetical protein